MSVLATPLQHCDPRDPRIACRERWEAQRAGDFMFWVDAQRSGWTFAERRLPLGHPEPPFFFTWCPWCLAPLPDLVLTLLRRLTIEDEEGG